MKINSKLSIGDFGAITEVIADAYFDKDGNYVPHYGLITAMRLFYDYCVIESKFDDKFPHSTTDMSDLNEVFADDEFIKAFNENSTCDRFYAGLNFGTAFDYAIQIAEERRSGLNRVLDVLRSITDGLAERVIPLLKDENITELSKAIGGAVEAGTTDDVIAGVLKKYDAVANKIDGDLTSGKGNGAKRPAKIKKIKDAGDVK